MKRIKRIVDTGFWSDEKVLNFSPEDKYFWLFLLTNEYTTQLGIYYLPIKKAAFDLGYSIETVQTLLERFEVDYRLIRYSEETSEVAIKNYLIYSIVKGGKPVLDCLMKEERTVKDKSLVEYVYHHLKKKDISNDTVSMFLEILSKYINTNDNDNERIVPRIVDESYHESLPDIPAEPKKPKPQKQERNIIPPSLEMVQAYCQSRNNGINAQGFIDFYDSKGWVIGKSKMKDWQATIRTWERHQGERSKPKPNALTQMMQRPTTTDELAELEKRLTAN